MARRRVTTYGTADMPPMQPGNFPLPPPPDGKPPVRLPFGAQPPQEPPAQPVEEPDGEMAMLLRLIQQGQR